MENVRYKYQIMEKILQKFAKKTETRYNDILLLFINIKDEHF
jgi:hypothetical protein